MAKVETNVKRVRKSVTDTQGRYALRTRALARKMAARGRDNVRSFISSPTFPGYAISGGLAKKVVTSEAQKSARGWVATFRVLATGKQAKYAGIHENGGKIPVSPAVLRAMFAALKRHNQLRARESSGQGLAFITIRPKRYFAKGTEKTRREWTISRLKREF